MAHVEIHKSTPSLIQRGDKGLPVWAVQRAFNKAPNLGYTLVEDGDFGPGTEAAVKDWQSRVKLTPDGVFGPQSQGRFVRTLITRIVDETIFPRKLLDSIVQGESGNMIAAVAWGSPGGVDCGYTQRRVYEADYTNASVVHRAFDSVYQIDLLAKSLRNLRDIFFSRAGTQEGWDGQDINEFAWRLAVLNHNYPYAADKISRYGIDSLGSYWYKKQSWVMNIGARFDDGSPVETPLQWCAFYSLGSKLRSHKGKMVNLVERW